MSSHCTICGQLPTQECDEKTHRAWRAGEVLLAVQEILDTE